MMYSAYRLNKQGNNIQPWCTPFPIWNHSVVVPPVLTVASWPAYRFLRRQVRYSHILKNFPQFVVIHRVKGFGIVNKTEVNACLELSCFFDVGNLISGSSAFSKSSLNIRKFTVHVLLKPGLENFEHYFDKTWSTGERNGKPLQYSCLENPMNSMKRQKDRTLKDELPRSGGAQYARSEERRVGKEC